MRLLRGIIGLLLAIIFVIFAVANRQDVDIIWSPIHPALNLPLYIIALGMLALGFLAGSLMTWLDTLPVRWSKGKQARQIRKLEKELDAAKEKDKSGLPPAADLATFPVKAEY